MNLIPTNKSLEYYQLSKKQTVCRDEVKDIGPNDTK